LDRGDERAVLNSYRLRQLLEWHHRLVMFPVYLHPGSPRIVNVFRGHPIALSTGEHRID